MATRSRGQGVVTKGVLCYAKIKRLYAADDLG